jgi:hypothetical protein
MNDLPPLLPTHDVVELVATVTRALRAGATPYASLNSAEQSWAWDHARSMLQRASFPVRTLAEWAITVPVPDQPVRSASNLLKMLAAADFASIPDIVAAALTVARTLAVWIETEESVGIGELERSLKMLDLAKLELADVPDSTALAVMASKCFLDAIMAEMIEAEYLHHQS